MQTLARICAQTDRKLEGEKLLQILRCGGIGRSDVYRLSVREVAVGEQVITRLKVVKKC